MNVSCLPSDNPSNSHETRDRDRVRPNHGNVSSSSVTTTNRHFTRPKKRESPSAKMDGRMSSSSSSSSSTKNNKEDLFRDNSDTLDLSPTKSRLHKFDFHVHRNIGGGGVNQNQNSCHIQESQEKLAQSLLASKQNILAQVSLTAEENLMRQQSPSPHSNEELALVDEDVGNQDNCDGASNSVMLKTSKKIDKYKIDQNNEVEQEDEQMAKLKKMTLCDIEDEDYDFGTHGDNNDETDVDSQTCTYSGNNNMYQKSTHGYSKQQVSGLLHIHKPLGISGEGRAKVKTMDLKTWRDLKMTISDCGWQEGWIGQGFSFDHAIPYGLVQNKGGPCGVLAVVQALVLRNLMFGSPFCDDDDLPLSEPITNSDITTMRLIAFRRVKALVCALTEIIWRCGHIGQKSHYNKDDKEQGSSAWTELSTAASNNEDEAKLSSSAIVCFNNVSVGSEIRIFEYEEDLKTFIHANLQRFDCVTLVYSAVLSRGIDNVQEDFDFPNSPLLGNHGYCSQELVNLLTIGKAISNVFDNQVALDEKILKGIESRSDIGFLSLFEHYDSCKVGNNLKAPKYPLWIVCSESHFSILFSLNLTVVTEADIDKFELYYYDGLARQQQQIKLNIELTQATGLHNHVVTTSSSCFNNNNEREDNEDLVPPLEKCIRTKWKHAVVDWNDTEPIL